MSVVECSSNLCAVVNFFFSLSRSILSLKTVIIPEVSTLGFSGPLTHCIFIVSVAKEMMEVVWIGTAERET